MNRLHCVWLEFVHSLETKKTKPSGLPSPLPFLSFYRQLRDKVRRGRNQETWQDQSLPDLFPKAERRVKEMRRSNWLMGDLLYNSLGDFLHPVIETVGSHVRGRSDVIFGLWTIMPQSATKSSSHLLHPSIRRGLKIRLSHATKKRVMSSISSFKKILKGESSNMACFISKTANWTEKNIS